jgi:hypothetical protein
VKLSEGRRYSSFSSRTGMKGPDAFDEGMMQCVRRVALSGLRYSSFSPIPDEETLGGERGGM